MARTRPGIVMNGSNGRIGHNKHLIRPILEIRKEGGVALKNGDHVVPDPILVGRKEAKIAALANAYNIPRFTTDLDAALADEKDSIFFDAATTNMRPALLAKAID